MQWRIYVKNNLVPAGLMPLQADSVSVCALTNSDWNSCSVLLPCIQDWLDDYEKNLSCALERGPFIQQILFAKLGREGRIFCTEMKCLTTATLLLASCTPTRTQHFVYVTWKIEENQSVSQSINQSCFVSVIDYTTQASFSLSPESDDWSSCHNATTPHHWQPWM